MVSRTIPAAAAVHSAPAFDAPDETRPEADAGLRLLDEVVAAMLLPQRQEPTAAMAATAGVLAGSSWRSYRAGRARVATQAAVYLTWLAPPASYCCGGILELPGGRKAFGWRPPKGRQIFADVLAPAGVGQSDLHQLAVAALRQMTETSGGPVAGVRVCAVSAPTRSVLATPAGTMVELTGTGLWFEGAR